VALGFKTNAVSENKIRRVITTKYVWYFLRLVFIYYPSAVKKIIDVLFQPGAEIH
jgi:hypothetical protein